MRILWFTWKDKKHAFAGGAEVVTDEICKRLVADGHEVIMISAGFGECKKKERINGYTVIRVGSRFSVYWCAYRYYKKYLCNWADLVIEEVNIVPFFTQFYIKDTPRVLFFHQLGRKVWFYQIFFPLNLLGYIIEPVYLFLLRKNIVITVSESTRSDLQRFGFKKKNIHIISEGLNIAPLADIDDVQKFKDPTILSLGEVRAMKRTLHTLRAFEKMKADIPDLKLIVAGKTENSYGTRALRQIKRSPYVRDITVLGRVSISKKRRLMQKSHVVTMTSVKEGWGLVITEANSQGTPCVVYNVDGLKDSVKDQETGIICKKNSSQDLSQELIALLCGEKYEELRRRAWMWSKEKTFDQCYHDFKEVLHKNFDKKEEI